MKAPYLLAAGLAAVIIAAVVWSVGHGQPSPPRDPIAERIMTPSPAVPRLVLALYYPWYALPSSSGALRHLRDIDPVHRRIGGFVHYPATGAYDSADERTLRRHFQELKAAGIDAIACSWWGNANFTAHVIEKILPPAQQSGLRVCLYLEKLDHPTDATATAQDLSQVLQSSAAGPEYLKIGTKPVMFVYGRAKDELGYEGWAETLAALEKSNPTGVAAITEGGALLDTLVFDGLHVNNPAPLLAAVSVQERLRRRRQDCRALVDVARHRRRVAVLTVSPGYDDRKVTRPGLVVDRDGGRFYRTSWETALDAQPDWVLVHSFNQWHDGTEIEPSAELGSTYLQLTAKYAARFRQGPPPTARTPPRR